MSTPACAASIGPAPCRHQVGLEIRLGRDYDLAILRLHDVLRDLKIDEQRVFVSGIYSHDEEYVFMVCPHCAVT